MTTEFAARTTGNDRPARPSAACASWADAETIYYMFVVDDDGHLAGLFPCATCCWRGATRKVEEFMEHHLISIRDDTKLEEVAQVVARVQPFGGAVIDKENVLRGIVTVDDAIDIILPLTWKKRLPKIFG